MSAQIGLFAQPSVPPSRVTLWSMWQPFAGLVAAGLKTLETRMFPWPVAARPYPSTLLICSTARADTEALKRFEAGIPPGLRDDTSLWLDSAALALVDVTGCRPLMGHDYARSWYWDPEGDEREHPGKTRYAWTLGNLRRVRPFAVAGGQGFSRSMTAAEVEQLGGARP